MKSLLLITLLLMPALSFSMNIEKTTFKVSGACGMCKERIENAAQLEGVSNAEWSQEDQMLELTYDPDQVDLAEVHKKIAEAGHDTEKYMADDEVYESLPACCHYDRKEQNNSSSSGSGGCCSN